MFRLLLPIASLFLCTVCWAQLQLKKEYQPYEPVEITVTTPENGQVLFDLEPLDGQTRYETREYTEAYAFWGEPGRYEVEVIVISIDFDTRDFSIEREKSRFRILGNGPAPPTPPEPPTPPTPPAPPDSDVAEDRFDNIGRRIDRKADSIGLQQDLRQRVAEIYQTASTQMKEPGGFIRVEDAKNYIIQEKNNLNLDSSWQPLFDMIKSESGLPQTISFQDAYDWYEAVAKGLKG